MEIKAESWLAEPRLSPAPPWVVTQELIEGFLVKKVEKSPMMLRLPGNMPHFIKAAAVRVRILLGGLGGTPGSQPVASPCSPSPQTRSRELH